MTGSVPFLIQGSIATPIGVMLVVHDRQGVRAIDWEDHEPRMRRLLRRHCGGSRAELVDGEVPRPVREAVERYFAGELDAFRELPAMTKGTAFQERV